MHSFRYRADQLLYAKVEMEDGQVLGYLCMIEPEFEAESVFAKAAGQMKAKAGVAGTVKPLVLKEVQAVEYEIWNTSMKQKTYHHNDNRTFFFFTSIYSKLTLTCTY